MSVKFGDILEIHCYKHDGSLHKIWDKSVVLEVNDDILVVANENVLVKKHDGRAWRTKEVAILFFYKKSWFNIVAQLKSKGLFYYCNISSPFVIDEDVIKFIDYDLDLRVFANGRFKVLDKNEYNYNKRLMKYPKDIEIIINRELKKLIDMKKRNIGPFDKKVIEKYYELYKSIIL